MEDVLELRFMHASSGIIQTTINSIYTICNVALFTHSWHLLGVNFGPELKPSHASTRHYIAHNNREHACGFNS